LTIQDSGTSRIEAWIRLKETRPFRTQYRPFFISDKTIFNKIVAEPHAGGFELKFAAFLHQATDVTAFTKNYLAIGFKLDYVKADGDLSNYTPDFMVKTVDGATWIIETKGREELDLPQKMARLRQWCEDANEALRHDDVLVSKKFDFVYVDQEGFERNSPQTFQDLAVSFRDYKESDGS
jgi:type III restriction enzyme